MAKHKELCEMEPLLHLMMVCTVLKVLDDHEIMCMHSFNFSKKKHILQIRAKLEDSKRGE